MAVLEVDHKELEQFIELHYENHLSLFIWGTTGIGKSETTDRKAEELAEKYDRKYVRWNELTETQKKDLEANPEKYFVFMDIRLSQMDPSDLRGIPALNGKSTVEWKKPFWLYVASLEKMRGVIFFDEINLAPPSIQASAYQLIHDRALDTLKLSDGMGVIAAGNRAEDKAQVYDLSKPLQNRFDHVTLAIPRYEDWTDWALSHGVDTRIIAFINTRPTLLMGKLDGNKHDMAFPTPRTWGKNCSRLIKGVKDLNVLESLSASAVGLGAALEFASFLKFERKINLQDILKHPESSKDITELDMQYCLISLLTEWYGQHHKKEDLAKVLEVSNHIQPELAIQLLRFVKGRHPTSFRRDAPKLPIWKTIWDKYGKYFEV